MDRPSKILLVEGQDDKHVVRHLWKRRYRSEPSFDIQDKEGVENLIRAIGPEIKVPNRVAVGIVVDANDSFADRWRAVSDGLRNADIGDVPGAPSPDGTIIDAAPCIGVWLMPDNGSSGEIENFVQRMIPSSDPAWPLAQEYVLTIPEESRKFSPKKTSRAELYAWLATRETPGRMGSAIGTEDLNSDGELCSSFLKWIERLFG